MSTLAASLEKLVKNNPNKIAIEIPDGSSVTYQQFDTYINQVSSQLSSIGVNYKDVVSINLGNGLPFLVSFLAITKIGAIAAPLNPAYKIDDYLFYLKDTETKVVLVGQNTDADQDVIKASKQLNVKIIEVKSSPSGEVSLSEGDNTTEVKTQVTTDDVALFLHTSGTTSLPKGVPLTHKNLSASINNIINTYELTEKDASIIVMPLFHVHGLIGATLSTLFSGGTVVIPPRFSASTFWSQVEKYNVTWYSAVPTIHQILLIRAETDKAPSGKLRFIRSCSSSLAPATYESLVKTFGTPVLEAYGMTEASHQMASNPLPNSGPSKIGTVGKATGIEISIRDDEDRAHAPGESGEICIKGTSITLGYHNRPDANKTTYTPSGWFRTGDQGEMDADGYVKITGRIKELINRGGEKISPMELDSVLLSHPEIADAVAFAAPDEKYGELVNCAVILKEGSVATESDIIAFCKSKMADFKVPAKIFITKELPRTATGKVQRRHVATHFLKK